MRSCFLGLMGSLVATVACAKSEFYLSERLYAAPGQEINVYYSNVFSSSVPWTYAFQTYAKKGRSYGERWCWTPTKEDAGTEVTIIVNAWNDTGLVASRTSVVEVAKAPADPKRKVTLALFSASSTNSGYPQVMMDDMLAAGYENFRMIGSRCKKPELGDAAAWYDGYGGFTCHSFLTQYKVSEEEYDNVQDAAEREQLKALGMPKKIVHEWQKALLRSPLVQFRDGKKVVDIPAWLEKVNKGEAPDFLVISLGLNDIFPLRGEIPELRRQIRQKSMPEFERFVRTMKAAMPKLKFAVTTQCIGCGQDGFAENYGAGWNQVQHRKIVFALTAELAEFVRTHAADDVIGLIPIEQAIDPVYSYPQVAVKSSAVSETKVMRFNNAVHFGGEGARQVGSAISAWLQCRWEAL